MASDPRAAFLAHSNYLLAFHTLIATTYTGKNPFLVRLPEMLTGVHGAVRTSPTYAGLTPSTAKVDLQNLRSALRNAWRTELILVSTGRLADDELLGVANNWAVIQSYYACYHAVQALTLARGQPSPTTHARLQQQYASLWVNRRVSLPPWSLGWQSSVCKKLPASQAVQPIHPWSTCDEGSCWDFVVQALRTTRQELLTERLRAERGQRKTANRKNWEHQEEQRLAIGRRARKKPRFGLPQLAPADKEQVDADLRPTSLVDYLYRLRLRSNYEDPTMFTDGPENTADSKRVYDNLVTITASTLLVHEMHIKQLMGRTQFEKLMSEWLNGRGTTNIGLQSRRSLILE